MKKVLIPIIIILGILCFGVLFILIKNNFFVSQNQNTSNQGGSVFPNNDPAPDIKTDPSKNYPLLLTNGSTINSKDFIKNPETKKSLYNTGHYNLTDQLSTSTPRFVIEYIEKDQTFTISILENPVMGNRTLAEQYLIKQLGVSQSEACQLRYTISAPGYVNNLYAGVNLGFSFCDDDLSIKRDGAFRDRVQSLGGAPATKRCSVGEFSGCTNFGDVNPDLLTSVLTMQSDFVKLNKACSIIVSSGSEPNPQETLPSGKDEHIAGEALEIRVGADSDVYFKTLFKIPEGVLVVPSTEKKYFSSLSDGSKIWAYRTDSAHWHIQLAR